MDRAGECRYAVEMFGHRTIQIASESSLIARADRAVARESCNQRVLATALRRKGIDLTPNSRECVSYGDLSMFMSCVI